MISTAYDHLFLVFINQICFAIAAFAGMIAYLEPEYFKLSDSRHLKNITIMQRCSASYFQCCWYFVKILLTTDGGKAGSNGARW